MTRRRRPATCVTGKVCHGSRGAAEAARARTGAGRVYRCACGSYHITSRSKWLRAKNRRHA